MLYDLKCIRRELYQVIMCSLNLKRRRSKTMNTIFRIFPAALLAIISFTWTSSAQAIPAFGTQANKGCSYCHSAWPQLNKKGRSFKELGYRLPAEAAAGYKYNLLDRESIPLSVVLAARPYYNSNGTVKMRALHEVELMGAGPLADNWSGYFEMEMEDEELTYPVVGGGGGTVTIPAFNWVLLPAAQVTYSVSKLANIQMAWAPVAFSDPYDSFSRRLTRKFDDVTSALGDSRQMVSVFGRANQLFYNVGYIGPEGNAGPTTFEATARVAFDITEDIMVGGLYVSDPVQSVTALDTQADVSDFRLNASYLPQTAGDITHLQAMYIMKDGRRPTWVPLVRYESNPGSTKGSNTTVNVARYLGENTKAWLEYRTWDNGDYKLTMQAYVAF